MEFAMYIKSLPNQQQDTIREIARLTCSTPGAVYRWLNGHNGTPLVKRRIIADYLNIPVEELFTNNDLMVPSSNAPDQAAKI